MSQQISVITPENFLEFAGGRVSVAQAANGFRPGSEEWGKKIYDFINERAPAGVANFLDGVMSYHFMMYEGLHGARIDAKDPDEWEGALAEQTVDVMTPHMALFCKADKVPDWLMQNAGDVCQLAHDPDFRKHVCGLMAVELTASLLKSRSSVNKVLSRLGIPADAKGWPAPVGEASAGEEGKPARRRGRPARILAPAPTEEGARRELEPMPDHLLRKPAKPRGRPSRKIAQIVIAGSWFDQITKNGVTVEEAAAVAGVTKQTLRKACEPGKDGLAVTYDIATALTNFVHTRILALQAAHANISMLVMMNMPLDGKVISEAA